jgi:hypothetical protein
MSDQSSAELEREADAARAKVAGTAESIRKKLTAGQMIDEFSEMFTGGDLSGMAQNLKLQVRDNPLPIALVGAGIAWLAFGQGATGRAPQDSYGGLPHRTVEPPHHNTRDSSGDDSSVMSSVTDGAKAAVSSVGDAVSGLAESVSSTADHLRHRAVSSGSHLPRAASSLADQEPLLIAALGLTFGAVIGTLLPATEFEKEQIGPQADRLRETAMEMIEKGRDSAERVGIKAYDALKDEADRQGLSADGPSVGERLSKVVSSVADAAGDAAREELSAGDENQDNQRPV